MALVTLEQAKAAANIEIRRSGYVGAKTLLKESAKFVRSNYDIFLSHSKMDENLVLGAKSILEKKGYTVYVDWIDDPQLDRSKVNRKTADVLRIRMRSCKLMFYLHTKSASLSKWCPWELGYFDGYTYPVPRVFIYPLMDEGERSFKGQEYLELYPVIDIDDIGLSGKGREDVWSHDPDAKRPFRRITGILTEAL